MKPGMERVLLRSAGLETEPDLLRRLGTISALLWILTPAGLIPAIVRLEPSPPALYLMAIASVVCGLGLLRLPWERLGWPALHATTLAALVAITISYVLSDQTFAAFFFMPATFAAYAFRRRSTVAAYLALVGVAIVLGLAWPGSDPGGDDITIAIAGFPILVIVACAVAYQRERLDESRSAYRRLALEAIRLSMKIGDHALASRSDDEGAGLDRLERVAAALELSEKEEAPKRATEADPGPA
jgi:hypothetical protein